MNLTTKDLDQIERTILGIRDTLWPGEPFIPIANRILALVAEVRRLRGLADDDTAVEGAGQAVKQAVYDSEEMDWVSDHSDRRDRFWLEVEGVLRCDAVARAALRAALGQEDA